MSSAYPYRAWENSFANKRPPTSPPWRPSERATSEEKRTLPLPAPPRARGNPDVRCGRRGDERSGRLEQLEPEFHPRGSPLCGDRRRLRRPDRESAEATVNGESRRRGGIVSSLNLHQRRGDVHERGAGQETTDDRRRQQRGP